MRTVAVVLVGVASAFGPVTLAQALPPDDLAAYCRATYPQVPFQIRCMSLERASQDRVAAARSAIDPATWSRCQGSSASWSVMEACLAQPTAATPGAGGAALPGHAGTSEPTDEQARRQPAEGVAPGAGGPASGEARATPGAPAAPTSPPAAVSGSPSTIILGPQANPALSAPENRPTRPVSEAEADRQLRNILERTGETSARCTKRQYGPGWVIVFN